MANTRRRDRYAPAPAAVDRTEAWLYDGLIDVQGHILKALDRNSVVYGRARDVSPGYLRFVGDVHAYAARYPTSDPRTWVPLAKAGVKADSLTAITAMGADSEAITQAGDDVRPYGAPAKAGGQPEVIGGVVALPGVPLTEDQALLGGPQPLMANQAEQPEDESFLGGLFGGVTGYLGDLGERVSEALTPAGDAINEAADAVTNPRFYDEVTDRILSGSSYLYDAALGGPQITAPAPVGNGEVAIRSREPEPGKGFNLPVGDTPARGYAQNFYSGLKGVTRTAFALGQFGQEAVVSQGALVAQALSDGDYLEANQRLAQFFLPVQSAGIGSLVDRATGGPAVLIDPAVARQTTAGQLALAYAEGDVDTGSGFFVNPTESEVGKAQIAARLAANTIVEAEPAPEQVQAAIQKVSKLRGEAEGREWAQQQGYQWDEDSGVWVTPAQGWTFGRGMASLFFDPDTTAYRTMSGIVDFAGAIFLDPLNYIPAGTTRKIATGLSGGKALTGAGGVGYYSRTLRTVADHDEVVKLLSPTVLHRADDALGGISKIEPGMTAKAIENASGGQLAVFRNGEWVGDGDDLDDLLRGGVHAVGVQERLTKLLDSGVQFRLYREGSGMLYTPDEVAAFAAEDRRNIPRLMRQGYALTTEQNWNWLTTGEGEHVVAGLVDATDALDILKRSNFKFSASAADQLARAQTPDEVRAILAPRLGVDIRHANDLYRFNSDIPTWSFKSGFLRATDFARLSDDWIRHVPGMELLPAETINVDDVDATVKQLLRLGRVAYRDIEDYAPYTDAMNRLIATANSPGPLGRAEKYQAIYGQREGTVVRNANGVLQLGDDEVEALIDEYGSLDDLMAMLPNDWTASRSGVEGVLTTITRRMVEETGVPEGIAKKVMTAFDDRRSMFKAYLQDGKGNPAIPPWERSNRAVPSLETDVLGNNAPLPDIHAIRQVLSRVGQVAADLKSDPSMVGKGARAMNVLDDVATASILRWKHLVLMSGGVRFPTYVMKATLDTQTAIALNGGASILYRPMDALTLVMTSTLRKAVAKDGPKEAWRLKIAKGLQDNPLLGAIWRDDFATDARGELFSEGWEKIMQGDPSGFELMHASLNASAGVRGALAVDPNYVHSTGDYIKALVNEADHWDDYVRGVAIEFHRLAGDPVARRLAKGEKFDDVLAWFTQHVEAQQSVVARYGVDAERDLATAKGRKQYVKFVQQAIRTWTGGDPVLMNAIGYKGIPDPQLVAGKVVMRREGFWNPKSSLAQTPSREFAQMLESAKARNVQLAQQVGVRTRAAYGMGKNWWDDTMRYLFYHAGRWEDVYAREPFLRERYWAHVEDAANMMLRSERLKMADDLAKRVKGETLGSPRLAKRLRAIDGDGWMTRAEAHERAGHLALQDMSDVAYDAANRREWAYALRLIAPFVQAGINGMYRWVKAAIKNPEMDYRFLRAAQFLTSTDSGPLADALGMAGFGGDPFFYTDPRTGERMFTVPLLGTVAQTIGSVVPMGNFSALPGGAGGSFGQRASLLNLAFPTAEQAILDMESGQAGTGEVLFRTLFPGVGPVVTAPLAMLTDGQDEWVADYLMPYGIGSGTPTQNIWEMFTPRVLANLFNAAFGRNSPELTKRTSARSTAIYAQLLANAGGYTSLTEVERDALWNEATSTSWTMGVISAFASPLTLGSIKFDTLYEDFGGVPEHQVYAERLGDIYSRYLKAHDYDYDAAEVEFVNDMGLEALMLATPSGPNSDAAPPTFGAAAMYRDYQQGYDHYGPVLRYLLPNDASDFDIQLWSAQVGRQERTRYTDEQRREAADQMILNYVYQHQLTMIANSADSEAVKVMKAGSLEDEARALGWKEPDYASADRDYLAMLMQQIAGDPKMTKYVVGGRATQGYLQDYLRKRDQVIDLMQAEGMKGDLAASTDAKWKAGLFGLGESYALVNPGFWQVWWMHLRNEVELEAED